MRLPAVAAACLALAPAATAARVRAVQRGDTLVLVARMASVGSYGASCVLPGFNVGTSLFPTDPVGKVRIRVALFGHRGAFSCWIRSGGLFTDPAAPLRGGRPAQVEGVAA